MATTDNNAFNELVSFLQESKLTELNQLASNLIEEQRRAYSDQEADLTEERSHTVSLEVSTDWDFYILGETDYTQTFCGKTKVDVIAKVEQFLLDPKTYEDGCKTHNDKLLGWINNYVPDIIKRLIDSDSYCCGGNWEVDASYNPPKVSGHNESLALKHFKLLGVTLSSKQD